MRHSLSEGETKDLVERLDPALGDLSRRSPGSAGDRQPVHTVYGGAHLFRADTCRRLGELALRSLRDHAPDPFVFARAIGLRGSERLDFTVNETAEVLRSLAEAGAPARQINEPAWLARTVYDRVVDKLTREAVEDFRIDFEDGYGNRPDDEEDGHAAGAASELAAGLHGGSISPFIGIRIKPFTRELMRRSLRTLDIFLTTLAEKSGGTLPPGFVITLPKIQLPEQVSALVSALERIEPKIGLAEGSLKLEFMIETTQSILDPQGVSNLPLFLDAAQSRAVAAHFGTYDYTASCNITASEQRMDHPSCDFARHMMQVAYAGTGLWLSDGATNIMPIAPHRAKEGEPLTVEQIAENRATVHRAWRLHVDHIRHSLVHAYYQGWDLHPAQLPTRYAALYAFFLDGLEPATERLRNFMERAAQATLVGDVFDDAATGQGLLNFFIRGLNSGALTEEEALRTGLTLEELRSRSFVKILERRRG
ncbi:MAG TPA: aldolase/citrate lyase family protein [Thermoanaerobaculia bacterium]|nr:aldolase/citrate lyase family protein [Thermoanaerobaculia bacterium]